jgi:hypothetical protein
MLEGVQCECPGGSFVGAYRYACPCETIPLGGDRVSSVPSVLQGESNLDPPEVTPPCQEHRNENLQI